MISEFIQRFHTLLPGDNNNLPWKVTEMLSEIVHNMLQSLGDEYNKQGDVAIHNTAVIEQHVVIKGPAIVGARSFIGANAYIRGPVLFDEEVHIGAGCEIKQTILFKGTAIAHFNYIGNSIIGSNVNFEAGSVAANHYNERTDKRISVLYDNKIINTNVTKFGSLVGDGCRIGANAVLSPGTLLKAGATVRRLELVEQVPAG